MAENKIYPWAQSSDANVFSDAEYAADVEAGGIYVGGVQTGLASSKQANKTWRQATAPGSGLAQFLVDNLSVDVTDADTPATFSSRIANAILKLSQISPFNQSWAIATGGYRKYAIVSDSSGNFWVSMVDNNTTDPSQQGGTPVWQDLFYSVSNAIASVQQNLNTAVENQSSINSDIESSLDDKLSISKGGTLHGDLSIGDSKWLYVDTIKTVSGSPLSVLNELHTSGDIRVGSGFHLYADYINSQSGTNIGVLNHTIFKSSMSVSNSGNEFGGNQTDVNNPIGGKLDGSYFDGRTLYQYSNGTTPTYIGTGVNGAIINLFHGSTQVGSISTNGSSVSYNTTSDYRLKHNVEPVDQNDCINVIKRLRPVSFTWKDTGIEDVGFLAHEVQSVVPNAVLGEKDGEKSQLLDTKTLIPYLLSVVQNLMNRVEELEASK